MKKDIGLFEFFILAVIVGTFFVGLGRHGAESPCPEREKSLWSSPRRV